jgi:beta-N-acetylhexosaminidase
MRSALVVGLAGHTLTTAEAAFLGRIRPAGIIIFERNASEVGQLRHLIADAVSAIDSADVLVLVDQEGGRVRRLRPPDWRDLPSASRYGEALGHDPAATQTAATAIARLTAHDLRRVGINTNCVPCADLLFDDAHAIIGDRAYGGDVETVVALAGAVAAGHIEGGVLPVLKHIPGHGRAAVDSHLALPIVDADLAELDATDFAPFCALASLPAAMTAHVVYTAIDPDNPATTSKIVIDQIVRGRIDFDGLLLTDDLSMQALSGSLAERAATALAAGCDIALHCNGNLTEMAAVGEAVRPLEGAALGRFQACLDVIRAEPEKPASGIIAAAEKALMQLGAA